MENQLFDQIHEIYFYFKKQKKIYFKLKKIQIKSFCIFPLLPLKKNVLKIKIQWSHSDCPKDVISRHLTSVTSYDVKRRHLLSYDVIEVK